MSSSKQQQNQDILSEFQARNCHHVTDLILRHVGVIGLTNANFVSKTWNGLVQAFLVESNLKDIFRRLLALSKDNFAPDVCR